MTLGKAEQFIDDYLKQAHNFSAEEVAIFYDIQNRCRAISNQRGWLAKGSCLTTYWFRRSKNYELKQEKITQKTLIQESKKVHIDTVNYTIFALEKLKWEIENNQFNLAAFFLKKMRKKRKINQDHR